MFIAAVDMTQGVVLASGYRVMAVVVEGSYVRATLNTGTVNSYHVDEYVDVTEESYLQVKARKATERHNAYLSALTRAKARRDVRWEWFEKFVGVKLNADRPSVEKKPAIERI